MQFNRPTQIVVGSELDDGAGRSVIVGDIPVAGEDGVGGGKIRIGPDEITEVLILKTREVHGGRTGVRGTYDDLWRDQFVREDLKVSKSKIEFPADPVGVLDEFERAAAAGGDGHGEFAVVIVRKDVKSHSGLVQVVDALNAFCPRATLAQNRQQQRRQDGDDGDDDE